MSSVFIMRQEESVGRNARCVSIIEKRRKKVRSERKEEKSLDARGDRRRLDNRRMPKPRAKVDRRRAQVCAAIYGKYRRHTAVLTCHHIDIVIICKCARAMGYLRSDTCCSGSCKCALVKRPTMVYGLRYPSLR